MGEHPGPLFAWHVLEEEEAARRERSAIWVANTRLRVEARRRAAEKGAVLRSPGRAPGAGVGGGGVACGCGGCDLTSDKGNYGR